MVVVVVVVVVVVAGGSGEVRGLGAGWVGGGGGLSVTHCQELVTTA